MPTVVPIALDTSWDVDQNFESSQRARLLIWPQLQVESTENGAILDENGCLVPMAGGFQIVRKFTLQSEVYQCGMRQGHADNESGCAKIDKPQRWDKAGALEPLDAQVALWSRSSSSQGGQIRQTN